MSSEGPYQSGLVVGLSVANGSAAAGETGGYVLHTRLGRGQTAPCAMTYGNVGNKEYA